MFHELLFGRCMIWQDVPSDLTDHHIKYPRNPGLGFELFSFWDPFRGYLMEGVNSFAFRRAAEAM